MEKQIHVWDYVVLCVGLVLSLGIGIFYAFKDRHNTTVSRYYKGDSKLNVLALTISMVVTVESTIMMLGFPAEVYVHGFIYVWANLGTIFAYTVCFFLTIPLFQPMKLISVFEYLQQRHNSVIFRQFIVAFSCFNMIIYSGVITFGTSIALSAVIGIPNWAGIMILVAITITYTTLGGFKAVVAADAVQGIVVVTFAIVLLVYGTILVGGAQKVIDITQSTGRLDVFDFDPNPLTRHTFWTLVIGNSVKSLGVTIFQPYVQRVCATKSIGDARKLIVFTAISLVVFHVIFMAQGLIAFAYFADKGCDPFAAKIIKNPNQIIPFMVRDMFGHLPGVTGLFLAALCSVSISTLSSLFNSISAVLVVDIIRIKLPRLSTAHVIHVAKGIVIICGIICVVISVLFSYIEGPLTQIASSLIGALIGPLVTVFYLSIFVNFTTIKGLVASTIVGYAFGLWVSFGYNFSPGRKQTPWMKLGPTDQCTFSNNVTTQTILTNETNIADKAMPAIEGVDNLYSISYMYSTLMVIIIALPTGLVVSWFTRTKERKSIPDHLMLRVGKRCMMCTPVEVPSDAEDNKISTIQQTDSTWTYL